MSEVPAYCPLCQRQVLARRNPASGILHLLLSLVTAGLWLPVWFFVATSRRALTHFCPNCGTPLLGPLAGKGRAAPAAGAIAGSPFAVRAAGLAVKCGSCGHANVGRRRCEKCAEEL